VSYASVVASLTTGHWFATPFALLFALGYSYVALSVVREQQLAGRAAASGELGAEVADAAEMARAA
jgi:hypothetical protein